METKLFNQKYVFSVASITNNHVMVIFWERAVDSKYAFDVFLQRAKSGLCKVPSKAVGALCDADIVQIVDEINCLLSGELRGFTGSLIPDDQMNLSFSQFLKVRLEMQMTTDFVKKTLLAVNADFASSPLVKIS